MYNRLKRSHLLLAFIPILALVFYVLTANNNIYADRSYFPININTIISDTKEKPLSGSPADYSAQDNFAIAAGIILDNTATPFYKSVTTGKIVANILNYTQEVENTKVVKNGEIFAESISLSAFASVAEQKYFKNNHNLYRKAKTSGKKVESWPDEIRKLSDDYFSANYGVIPREITKYSVTKDSYLEGNLVSQNSDGTYTFNMKLNAEKAQYYAMREIMTFAGIDVEPKFFDSKLTYTLDSNWRVLEILAEDNYEISMMGGTKCKSTLREVFTYTGDMPERAQIFIDHLPPEDPTDPEKPGKTIIDYLSEGFADYITNNKPINLDASINIGYVLPIKARIDIANSEFKIKLGDTYIEFSDDVLYIDNVTHKGKITSAELKAAAEKMGIDISLGNMFGEDMLEILFADSKIIETDSTVTVTMKFNLLGLNISANIVLNKQPDGSVVADSITGSIPIDFNGMKIPIAIKAKLVDGVELPEIDRESFISYNELIDSVANTVTSKTFEIDSTFNLSGKINQTVTFSGKIALGNPLTISGDVGLGGTTFNVVYDGSFIYLSSGNVKLKVDSTNTDQLITAIETLTGVKLELPEINTDELIKGLISSLIPKLTSPDIFNDILGSVDYDGTTFSVKYATQQNGDFKLELSHNNGIINRASIDKINIMGINISADIDIIRATPDNEQIIIDNAEDYVNINDFLLSGINTLFMRKIELNGNIELKMTIPFVNIKLDVSVPFNVKINQGENNNINFAAKLEVPYKLAMLTKSDSYMYYSNERLYFIVDLYKKKNIISSEMIFDKTETKSCTLEEFMSNPFDYIFYLIRLSDTVKGPIMDAINNGGSGGEPSTNINDILKEFTFKDDNYKIAIGLKELSGNKDLSDAVINISTKNNHITALNFSTKFVDFIELSLGNGAAVNNLTFDESGKAQIADLTATSFGKTHSTGKVLSMDSLGEDLNLIFTTIV